MAKYRIQTAGTEVYNVEAITYREVDSLVIFTRDDKTKAFALPVAHVKTIELVTDS